jgi:hypothetical protein
MAERGDVTGRQIERLRAENALLLSGRRGQLGMTVGGDFVIEEDGICDPRTGERLSPQEEAELEAQSKKLRRQRMSGKPSSRGREAGH